MVRAQREGPRQPLSCLHTDPTVLFTVENTDPHCYWLTNYLETLIVQVWCADSGRVPGLGLMRAEQVPADCCNEFARAEEDYRQVLEWYGTVHAAIG